MKNTNKVFWIIFLAVLSGFTSSACDNTGGGTKTADPYPVKRIENVSREIYDRYWISPDYTGYLDYLYGIYGDDEEMPDELLDVYLQYLTSGFATPGTYGVGDKSTALHEIYDVVLYEYTHWYQPNGPLTLTLTDIDATSITDTITTTLGFSAAYSGIGISGSIKKETGTTVNTVRGRQATQTWDLREYDQSKNYKVVLVGNLTGIEHEVMLVRREHDTLVREDTFYSVLVDQSSVTVKLVHD